MRLHAKLRLNHQQYFRFQFQLVRIVSKSRFGKRNSIFVGTTRIPLSLEKRAFYILPTRVSVYRLRAKRGCRISILPKSKYCCSVIRVEDPPPPLPPSPSFSLSLPRSAYCALRKVKRIRDEMVKDEPKHVRRLYLSLISRQEAVTSSRN